MKYAIDVYLYESEKNENNLSHWKELWKELPEEDRDLDLYFSKKSSDVFYIVGNKVYFNEQIEKIDLKRKPKPRTCYEFLIYLNKFI